MVDEINIMTQKFKNRTDGCIIIPGTRVKRTFFNMDSQNNHSQCDHQPSVCRNFRYMVPLELFEKMKLALGHHMIYHIQDISK